MAIRTNSVTVDHGDINAIDGAAAYSFVGTFVSLDGTTIPGITKGNLFLLYPPGDGSLAGGESAVWEYKSTDTGLMTAGVPRRVAGVYDGSLAAADRWKMWVDGVAQTMTGSTPGATFPSTTSVLEVGKSTTSAVDGLVSDIKMWSAALTAQQVIDETWNFRPLVTTGLILWAPYLVQTDLVDYSGSGNHGTNASASTVRQPRILQAGVHSSRRNTMYYTNMRDALNPKIVIPRRMNG